MVSGMKTLGEKVTRLPCAPSRTTRASAVRSSRGVVRRSASESIGANLGGVGARGAVDQPQRVPGMDPGGGQVVPTDQRGHRLAFDAPDTVKTARRAELMAGSVRVSRGWGLTPLGSSVASTRTPGSASRVGASGKSEAVCPSGPMPRWMRSMPGPVTRSAMTRW